MIDTKPSPLCPYCQTRHANKCALIKAYEYYPDGAVKRVEFYAPNDYSPSIFANMPMPQSLRDVQIT